MGHFLIFCTFMPPHKVEIQLTEKSKLHLASINYHTAFKTLRYLEIICIESLSNGEIVLKLQLLIFNSQVWAEQLKFQCLQMFGRCIMGDRWLTRPPFCFSSPRFHCVRDSKYLTLPDNHNTLLCVWRKSVKLTLGEFHFPHIFLNWKYHKQFCNENDTDKVFLVLNWIVISTLKEGEKQLPDAQAGRKTAQYFHCRNICSTFIGDFHVAVSL